MTLVAGVHVKYTKHHQAIGHFRLKIWCEEEEEGSWNQAFVVPTTYWVSAQYLISELIRGMMDGFVLLCLTQRMRKTRQLVSDDCCFCCSYCFQLGPILYHAFYFPSQREFEPLSLRWPSSPAFHPPTRVGQNLEGWGALPSTERVPGAALLAVFRMSCSMISCGIYMISCCRHESAQGTGVAVPWSNISAVLNQRFSMVLAFFAIWHRSCTLWGCALLKVAFRSDSFAEVFHRHEQLQ